MKREIKFRAWDKEKKEMIYDNNLAGMPNMMTFNGWVYKNGKLQPYIMLQYTGLLDKHWKEIYEGDIVEFWIDNIEEVSEVFFKDGCFSVKTKNTDPDYQPCLGVVQFVEIIGNIYESKTIAKEGEGLK